MLVLKIGGSLEISDALAADVAAWPDSLVIVHGAHRRLDDLAVRLGHPPRMVTSPRGETSRYSDAQTMDHFLMAYCGLVNKRMVERLRREKVNAVGLSALDGGIAVGRRREHLRIRDGDRIRVLHDDHAGSIERIEPRLLHVLLESGHVPVLSPPAVSLDGVAINVDGDRLAAELAIALGAQRLLILMDRPGLLRDPHDESTVIPRVARRDIPRVRDLAAGRARVKLAAAERAFEGGVTAVGLCDGRMEHPLSSALEGAGTWLTA